MQKKIKKTVFFVFSIVAVILFPKQKTDQNILDFRAYNQNKYIELETNIFNDLELKKEFLTLFFEKPKNYEVKNICIYRDKIINENNN